MTPEIVPEGGAWKQEENRKGKKTKKRKRNVGEDLSTQKTINQEEGKRVIQEGQTVKSCALLTFLLCLFFFGKFVRLYLEKESPTSFTVERSYVAQMLIY